jgi:hypothetical protein
LLDLRAAGIDQHHAAATPAGSLLYNSAQGFENGLQGISLGNHFENTILPSKQQLCAFSVFDVGVRSEPFDNLCVAVQRRSRAEKKPAIRAIELS